MGLSYVADMAFPVLCPVVQNSLGAVAIALAAGATGAVQLQAELTPPPNLAFYTGALAQVEAQLSAGASLGLPALSFDASTSATLVADLQAALPLLVTLEGLLDASIGMYAFSYNGIANALGGALTTELATQWPDGVPSSGSCNALIFGATSPIAQTQIQKFLNGLTIGTGLQYIAKWVALSLMTPVTASATSEGAAAIQAQLNAALAIQAKASITPPTLAVTAAYLANFIAGLKAPPPVAAAIKASVALQSQFALMVELGMAFGRYDATVFVYTYSGPANAMGAAVTSALASTWGDGTTPTNTQCIAAVLGTVDAFTWTTMTSFFGGA